MVTQVAFSKVQSVSGETQSRLAPTRAAPRQASAPTAQSEAQTASASVRAAEQASSALALDPMALENAVQNIARSAQNLQRSLQFSVDEISGRTVITVIDKETQEVIRQIPREEILALADHFGEGPGTLVETEA